MGEEKKKEKKSKKKDKAEESEAATDAAADDAPAEGKKATRASSNVFALFKQAQITEFKEAFTMIDQDRDGLIGIGDLQAMWEQVGRNVEQKQLKEMVDEAPGQLNFTSFLTLFGEKLHGTDPESTLRDAFAMFDEEGKGVLPESYVKELLTEVGDQFNKDEIKQTWKEAPIEGGMLDYKAFVGMLKGKEKDGE